MAADGIRTDAVRFLVAGGVNTALTSLIYFVCLTLLSSSASYAIAWLAGLALVMLFYPDRVFPGGRTGLADRLAMGGSIVVVFLVGLASLHCLQAILQNTAIAFFATLAITTGLNFLISRWILRGTR